MRLFVHHEGLLTHRKYLFGVIAVKGDYGGLVDYDLVVVDDQGICGAEVDGDILGEPAEKSHFPL
jgi:hypothetical protein